MAEFEVDLRELHRLTAGALCLRNYPQNFHFVLILYPKRRIDIPELAILVPFNLKLGQVNLVPDHF